MTIADAKSGAYRFWLVVTVLFLVISGYLIFAFSHACLRTISWCQLDPKASRTTEPREWGEELCAAICIGGESWELPSLPAAGPILQLCGEQGYVPGNPVFDHIFFGHKVTVCWPFQHHQELIVDFAAPPPSTRSKDWKPDLSRASRASWTVVTDWAWASSWTAYPAPSTSVP